MAAPNPQSLEKVELSVPASAMPQDYYSILAKVITDASADPAQLRKLVYVLAWYHLNPESVASRPLPDATKQATTIWELECGLELERAIERIEADAAREPSRQIKPPRLAGSWNYGVLPAQSHAARSVQGPAMAPDEIPGISPEQSPGIAPEQDPEMLSDPGRGILREESRPTVEQAMKAMPEQEAGIVPEQHQPPFASSRPASIAETTTPPPQEAEPMPERPRNETTLIMMPPQRPAVWLERSDGTSLERIPAWLDPSVRVTLDSVDYSPIQQTHRHHRGVVSFLQLIGAAFIGVALYAGISGWVYLGRQSAPAPAAANAPASDHMATGSMNAGAVSEARAKPEPQPLLPFPLPKTYGVYAGGNGQLVELDPLPIRIPDRRVMVSAEITQPSRAVAPSDKLTFVVFRRDLVNSAPDTASVRIVARVARATKFVGGRATVAPMDNIWRVRSKSYDFRVSPLEGRREMIVIQPDPEFTFPPGRYALVLDGSGYDFTVPGPVTAPDQCLEQADVVNGSVLAECPKS